MTNQASPLFFFASVFGFRGPEGGNSMILSWLVRLIYSLETFDKFCLDPRIKKNVYWIFISFSPDINSVWIEKHRFAASFCGIHVFIKGFIIHCLAN